ncbi:MAG: PAS domain S-box protein [Accumulibacter sp.]|jgi:PAS domain S-box-containing protein
MTLSRRLLGTLLVVLGIGFAVLAVGQQYCVRRWVEANVQDNAERVQRIVLAMRQLYHRQFIDSGLPVDEGTLGFLPAHAMQRIGRDLESRETTGLSVRNVAVDAGEGFDQADDVEMAAIEHFRAHPQAQSRFVAFAGVDGQRYYLHARPIRTDQGCRECSGAANVRLTAAGPERDDVVGHRTGDLQGILSIRVPATPLEAQAQARLLWLLGAALAALALLGIGTAWAVDRQVIRPLRRLEEHIQVVAGGNLSRRITGLKGEFGRVGDACNRMAENLSWELARREESDRRFRTIFEQSAFGIAIVAIDGRWLRINQRLGEMLGYGETELLSRSLQEDTHAEDVAADRDQMQRMLDREVDSASIEKRYRRKGGTILWATTTMALVRQENGEPAYFIAAVEDISRRKEAELARQESDTARDAAVEALRAGQRLAVDEQRQVRRATLSLLEEATAARIASEEAAAALRQSEERFRALVEQSIAGIYIRQDDRLRYVNPGFAAIFGYESAADLIDRVAAHELVSPEDRTAVRESIGRCLEGESSSMSYTCRGVRRDGQLIEIEVHARRFDYLGKPAVIGLVLDITARKLAEQELRRRNDELERFNRASVGRELDMVGLKKRINELSRELGREPPYPLAFLQPTADSEPSPGG